MLRTDDSGCQSLLSMNTGGCGTLLWMAPEIIDDLNKTVVFYGQPADMYSVGMIMYECIELNLPWYHIKSEFSSIIIDAVLEGKRPLMSSLKQHNAPKKMVSLMESCWAQRPAERPCIQQASTAVKKIQADFVHHSSQLQQQGLAPGVRNITTMDAVAVPAVSVELTSISCSVDNPAAASM